MISLPTGGICCAWTALSISDSNFCNALGLVINPSIVARMAVAEVSEPAALSRYVRRKFPMGGNDYYLQLYNSFLLHLLSRQSVFDEAA
jgi:hypothetical protein